jgi:hypothetical protein
MISLRGRAFLERVVAEAFPDFQSRALGVGSKYEPAVTPVRRTHVFRSASDCRRDVETHCSKVSEGLDEGSKRDVLEEDQSRICFGDDAGDVWPEVAGVSLGEALPGDGEGLTRESRRDEIHDSAPRSSIEGREIRPERRWIQPPRFHLSHQYRCAECFPLHVTDRTHSGLGKLEAEADASVPGT